MCLSDSIDPSFLTIVMGVIGISITILVGIVIYFRTMDKTEKLLEKPFKLKFIQNPDTSDAIITMNKQ